MAAARPSHAFAAIEQKQRAVGGALQQAAAAIEKLIGQPFQANAAVRAAVEVQVHSALMAHSNHRALGHAKATGLAFLKVAGRAEEVH